MNNHLKVNSKSKTSQKLQPDNTANAEELACFFDLSPDIFFIIGQDGYIKRVNAAGIQFFEYSEEELMAKPFIYFIHTDDILETQKEFDATIHHHEKRSFENRCRKKYGEYSWLLWTIKKAGADSVCCMAKDITRKSNCSSGPSAFNKEIATLPDSITDGIFMIDREWKVRYANKVAEQIAGIKKEQAIGKVFWDFFPEGKDMIFFEEYEKAFNTQQPVRFESYYEPLQMWFKVSAYPADNLLSVIVQNITEKKVKENEIKQINERYTLVSKATSEAIWDWEVGSEYAFWHGENYKNLFGYDAVDQYEPCEFWRNNLHPSDRERIIKKHWDAIRNGDEYWSDYYKFKKANGEYAYVKDRALIVRDEAGNAIRMIGAMDDITAQKLAEDALTESEKSYKTLFNNAPLPQFIYDTDTLQFLNANDAAIEHYGYSIGEFLKMTLLDIRPEKDYKKLFENINISKQTPGNETSVWTHLTKSGEQITVEVTSCSITFKGQPARLAMIHDITEKRKLEKEIIKLRVQKQKKITQATLIAQEKERQQIGKDLHDNINQVLTTTKLYLELARSNESMRMNLIERSEKNLINTINELRSLSRSLVPPTLQDVGLTEAIQELLDSYLITKKFVVHFTFEGCIENTDTEIKLAIYRIIQEQLNNITKYSEAQNVYIKIWTDATLNLMMKDDGKGFDVNARRKGLGINNIINRVELYNGTIKIESGFGNGCQLSIAIPAYDKPPQ